AIAWSSAKLCVVRRAAIIQYRTYAPRARTGRSLQAVTRIAGTGGEDVERRGMGADRGTGAAAARGGGACDARRDEPARRSGDRARPRGRLRDARVGGWTGWGGCAGAGAAAAAAAAGGRRSAGAVRARARGRGCGDRREAGGRCGEAGPARRVRPPPSRGGG